MKKQAAVLALGLGAVVALAAWAVTAPGAEKDIGSYTTSLEGRTPSQVHNVVIAAKATDGKIVMPGETFSFVKTVGAWTADKGYKKAPVSYDGELVRNWGGGVCQLSSTLYNAALVAGFDIVERHRHQWPARYAPVGRDAAVAYAEVDLRFRNNLPDPIRIACSVQGSNLTCRILSRSRPSAKAEIETRILSVTQPSEVLQDRSASGGKWKLMRRGYPGFHVVTYRRFMTRHGTRREIVSEDTYPPMNRLVRIID